MCEHLVSVLKLDTKHSIGQGLHYRPLQYDRIFLGLGQLTLLKQHSTTVGILRYIHSNCANCSLGRLSEVLDFVRLSDLDFAYV